MMIPSCILFSLFFQIHQDSVNNSAFSKKYKKIYESIDLSNKVEDRIREIEEFLIKHRPNKKISIEELELIKKKVFKNVNKKHRIHYESCFYGLFESDRELLPGELEYVEYRTMDILGDEKPMIPKMLEKIQSHRAMARYHTEEADRLVGELKKVCTHNWSSWTEGKYSSQWDRYQERTCEWCTQTETK